MNCKICFEKYDHSKRRPYCLLPCAHTFCADCLKKSTFLTCPNCKSDVTGQSPNWELIQLVNESKYDLIKSEVAYHFSQANDLKKKLEKLQEVKEEENIARLAELRRTINSKADELIRLVESDRARLLEEAKHVEEYLTKKLNESKINLATSNKFKQIETQTNTNDLSETELTDLNAEIVYKKFEFANKIEEIEKINNSYEIMTSWNSAFPIGEITNKNWITSPITSVQYINLGKVYHEQLKSYERALELYNKAIELNPNSSIAYRNKGLLYYDTKDYKSALECYERAIALEPTNKNGYLGKSNVLKALKYHHSALDCFDQVIKLDPNHVIAHYTKGNVYREQKQFENAIKCYDRTIEINKYYTNSYYSKGLVLKEMKKFPEAIGCFDKVIDLDPFYVNAYLSKAYALRELKRYNEAMASFDKCLEIESNFAAALTGKSNLLKSMKENK